MLELRDICKSYPMGADVVEVLHGVTAEIRPGKLVAIVGPSGSGKSTLLNLIGTLDTPSSGRLLFDGREIGSLSPKERTRFRARNLGFVFQFFNLLPGLSARQNVELAAAIADGDRGAARSRSGELLARVGLGDRVDAPARKLSGGQHLPSSPTRAARSRCEGWFRAPTAGSSPPARAFPGNIRCCANTHVGCWSPE